MSLVMIHNRLWVTILLFSFVMALWGFLGFFRKQKVDSSYFGAVAIAEILYLIQVGIGVFLLVTGSGALERPQVHIIYGVVVVLVLPAVFIYTRAGDSPRTLIIYAVAFLFLIAIAFRSMLTGS